MITRRPALLSSAAAVIQATSGCTFLPDLAEPDPPATAPSVSAPAATVPSLPEPVEVATAVLTDRDELLEFSGTVRVAVSPAAGLPPLPGPSPPTAR